MLHAHQSSSLLTVSNKSYQFKNYTTCLISIIHASVSLLAVKNKNHASVSLSAVKNNTSMHL